MEVGDGVGGAFPTGGCDEDGFWIIGTRGGNSGGKNENAKVSSFLYTKIGGSTNFLLI